MAGISAAQGKRGTTMFLRFFSRPSAISFATFSGAATKGYFSMPGLMSVFTKPGCTMLTAMPRPATSMRSASR